MGRDVDMSLDLEKIKLIWPMEPTSINGPHYHIQALMEEVESLRSAIRLHRDEKGHDRCWLDDQRLYSILPEGNT